MIKNYIKIALRNLARHKIYSLINIIGLAVGITCCILISLFIINELNYDKHNKNYNNIYRVVTDMFVGGKENNLSVAAFPTAPALKKDYPEVTEAARLVEWNDPFIKIGDKNFREKDLFFADNSLLNLFTFNFIEGNELSLTEPNSVILTKETAEKYFGNKSALGEIILYENNIELQVTGVVEAFPSNSHFNFNLLVSFPTLEQVIGRDYLESWHAFFKIYTYILLPENYPYKNFNKKMPDFVNTYMADEIAKALGRKYKITLQPLSDLHLYSDRMSEPTVTGSIQNIYVFSLIAFIILLLACINFINLSTARSIRRAKEISLRKVLGAGRKQLIFQFIGESFISLFLALPLAVFLAELFLPYFNSISAKELSLNILFKSKIILPALFFLFIIGISAGIYPAFFLSKGKLNSLKSGSNITSERSSSFVRKGLIVFQFTISVALIICTIVVINQLDFIRDKKLGMEKESIIVFSFSDEIVRQKYPVFYESILKNPSIINASLSSYLPAKGIIKTPVKKESSADNEKFEMATLPVDNNFIETFEISLAAGRPFYKEFSADTINSFLINETAAIAFGWGNPEEAIGKNLEWLGTGAPYKGKIIGVVKDFHIQSLHNKIEPLLIIPQNLWPFTGLISVKTSDKNFSSVISFIEKEWNKVYASVPFEYSFLDEDFGKLYLSEEKLSRIFGSFSLLAIFIASLGLFGLSAFSAEVKTKEIGIRKVLGASSVSVVNLLSKEFLLLVAIANLIAAPIAYFAMKKWLEDFAYKTDINNSVFIIAAVAALIISFMTVLYQSLKAANKNPVTSLRYE